MVNHYRRDLEEPDELLDEDDSTTVEFWERKQRELVLSVVDYNLQGLADLVIDKTIDLAPSYQRRLRWDEKRQSKLIESFLMNVPVPPVFLNEDEYGQFSVIDGKQRITSIVEFMRGKLVLKGLSVFSEINGASLDDLPNTLQRVIRTRPTIRAVIILRQSDPDVKFNVFQRLNTGGVRLNAQEIRNSAFPGTLNTLIMRLSELPTFHRLLGIRNRQKSVIYQEMRDAEFVLRFFTFRRTWATFSGGMKRQMDNFMVADRHADDELCSELESEFLHVLDVVEAAFGERAFHRWLPDRRTWKNQVLAALYDAQMFAAQEFTADAVAPHREVILGNMQRLFEDAEFRRSMEAATNTPKLFKERIRMVARMLRSSIGANE